MGLTKKIKYTEVRTHPIQKIEYKKKKEVSFLRMHKEFINPTHFTTFHQMTKHQIFCW